MNGELKEPQKEELHNSTHYKDKNGPMLNTDKLCTSEDNGLLRSEDAVTPSLASDGRLHNLSQEVDKGPRLESQDLPISDSDRPVNLDALRIHSLVKTSQADKSEMSKPEKVFHAEDVDTFTLGKASHAESIDISQLDKVSQAGDIKTSKLGKAFQAEDAKLPKLREVSLAGKAETSVFKGHLCQEDEKETRLGVISQPDNAEALRLAKVSQTEHSEKISLDVLNQANEAEVFGQVEASQADNAESPRINEVLQVENSETFRLGNVSHVENAVTPIVGELSQEKEADTWRQGEASQAEGAEKSRQGEVFQADKTELARIGEVAVVDSRGIEKADKLRVQKVSQAENAVMLTISKSSQKTNAETSGHGKASQAGDVKTPRPGEAVQAVNTESPRLGKGSHIENSETQALGQVAQVENAVTLTVGELSQVTSKQGVGSQAEEPETPTLGKASQADDKENMSMLVDVSQVKKNIEIKVKKNKRPCENQHNGDSVSDKNSGPSDAKQKKDWNGFIPSNYALLLRAMLNKHVDVGQSLVKYYYEKMNLLNKCQISGKNAVDCILEGIKDDHVRRTGIAAKFTEPAQVLTYFKSIKIVSSQFVSAKHLRRFQYYELLNVGKSTDPAAEVSEPVPNPSHISKNLAAKKNRLCYNCKQPGHRFRDCVKPISKCAICEKFGHRTSDCDQDKDYVMDIISENLICENNIEEQSVINSVDMEENSGSDLSDVDCESNEGD